MVRRHELTDEQWQVIQPLLPVSGRRVVRTGTLSALVAQARVIAEAIDELDREVSVDSSIVRAHQHAAGARRRPVPHTGGKRILERAERAR